MIKKSPHNFWKVSFIILFFTNIIVIIAFIILLYSPVHFTEQSKTEIETSKAIGESSEFIVRTTRENLNELINAYLKNLLKGTDHEYQVILKEDVHLIGQLPVFSSTVPLSVHLEPFVQDDGNILLKVKSISLGLLKLPNKKIMEYISKDLVMPKWVTVNPKAEEIYVAVTEMDIKSNFQIRAEAIDLEANNIALKFFVPYKTLGIE